MDLQQVAPGLWRWTTPHPDWEAPKQEDDPADWARDVGSVAYETTANLVLIDPLIANGNFATLDEMAEKSTGVAILTTLEFHRRSRDELAQRYAATTTPPDGIDAIEIRGAGETMYWIPEHGALVPGDRIRGDRPPGLRLCPESWLRTTRLHAGRPAGRTAAAARPPRRDRARVARQAGARDGRAELERALSWQRVTSIERELRAAVDAEVVAPTAAYLTDMTEARGLIGRADAVALPRTAEEVAEVVAWCYAHGVAIVPRGGGTGYAGGSVPLDGGVVLSLDV